MKLSPLYLLAAALFLLHQYLQKVAHISIPLADQYLDPLLCMPLLLGIWQFEKKLLFNRRITTLEIWTLTLVLTLLFEIGFPRMSPEHFTADWRDALLYIIGTVLYLIFRASPH